VKLRFQLALLVAVALVAALAFATVAAVRRTRLALEEAARQDARDAAEEIAHDLQRQPPLSEEAIERRLNQSLARHNLAEVTLELEAGENDVANYNLKAKSDGLVKRHQETLSRLAHRTLHSGRDAGVDVEGQAVVDGRIGRGLLRTSVSLVGVQRQIDAQTRSSVGFAAVALVLALVLVVLAADALVGRPLARLASTMRAVSEGALDKRVAGEGPPEVRGVSEAFNAMLARLEQADQAVRGFNGRLAREVSDATAELVRRNEDLARLNTLLSQAREDLAHRERLAALGQLAAQLAHEIGTPLGSVSGHLQLALGARDAPGPVRERLRIAVEEVQRVSRIIRDYLDSTRRHAAEIAPVEVAGAVREAVEVARAGLPQRAALVHVRPSGPVVFATDAGILRQLVVNLAANALDAVAAKEGGGEVEVTVEVKGEQRATTAASSGRELVVTVADTGIGLTDEQLSRMFEPFYTTKGRGKGTGLGLSICRELALGLGGRIDVASRPGTGTTFTLHLPEGRTLHAQPGAAV
jgi:signal transduction histidine kinase